MATKKQHYVWQKYLEPWVINNQIYALRNGKILHTTTKNILCVNYMYNLKMIDIKDIEFANEFITKQSIDPLKILHKKLYDLFYSIINMRNYLIEKGFEDENIINKYRNFEEDLQSDIENDGFIYLQYLYRCDNNFYNDYKSRFLFLRYLMMQIFRTKKIKDIFNLINDNENEKYLSNILSNINGLLIHLFTINTAFSIANDNYNIVFLKNNTRIKFLTSDFPVNNTFSDGFRSITKDTQYEIYYPLTPTLSIMITNIEYDQIMILDESSVNKYNSLVKANSYEYIISSNEEQLKI